jgi:formate dehydrogenase subunit gamma
LHVIQDALGFIPATAVPTLANGLQLSRAEVHGVISFYSHFREAPAGRVVVEVCRAESCQAMGGEQLAEHAKGVLGCDFHGTAKNGQVTLEPVYCLGLCAQSPAVTIDGQPHARMTPAKLDQLLSAKGV